MMRRAIGIAALAAAVLAGSGCRVVQLPAFGIAPTVDVVPGDRLDVVTERVEWDDAEWHVFVHDCNESGGTITDAEGQARVCQNIDY